MVKIDKQAVNLLRSKENIISLLPIGVIDIHGDFYKGDIIEIVSEKKEKIGFGITQYDSQKAKDLIKTKNKKPIIHYNYMFINI